MDDLIFRAAMFCVLVVCFLGVFSCGFKDTLFQRIGMAITALGAFGLMFNKHEQTMEFFGTGVAIYCVATSIKLWRKEHGAI